MRADLNYMGDVGYMISKFHGTTGSSVGTGAVVVARSNSDARKVALRYPSLGVVVGCILAQVVIALVEFCGVSVVLRGRQWNGGEHPFRVFCGLGCCVLNREVLARVERPSARSVVIVISRLRGSMLAARRTRGADGDGRTWRGF